MNLSSPDGRRDPEQLRLGLFYARQMLQWRPDDVKLLAATAQFYYFLGQLPEAEKTARRVLEVDGKEPETHVLLGLVLHKTGRPREESLHHYLLALESLPDHVLANTNAGSALIEMGRPHEGRKLIEVALKNDPNYAPALSGYGNSIAHIEEDYARESTFHEKAVAMDPSRIDFKFNLCLSFLQAGEFGKAEKLWKKWGRAFLENPQSAEARAWAEAVPLVLSPPSDPWECAQLAQELGPLLKGMAPERLLTAAAKNAASAEGVEKPEFLKYLGVLAGHLDLHDLSLRLFEEALALDPSATVLRVNIAVALSALDRHDEALEMLGGIDPSVERRATILGNILRNAGRLEEALAAYELALTRDAGFHLPLTVGVVLAVQLKQYERVEMFRAAARRHFEGDAEVALAMAHADLALGHPKRATEWLLPVLFPNGISKDALVFKLDNEDFTVLGQLQERGFYELLAYALLASRQFDRLFRLLEWASEHYLGNGNFNVVAAEALRRLGDVELALCWLQGVREGEGPRTITEALCSMECDDTEAVMAILKRLESDPNVADKIHPVGKPLAVASALTAEIQLRRGEAREAELEARKALEEDPTCSRASLVLVRSIVEQGETSRAIEEAEDRLRNCPSDVDLAAWIIREHERLQNTARVQELKQLWRERFESYGLTAEGTQLCPTVPPWYAPILNAWKKGWDRDP